MLSCFTRMFAYCDSIHLIHSSLQRQHVNVCLFSCQNAAQLVQLILFLFLNLLHIKMYVVFIVFHYINNALSALFETVYGFLHSLLLLCICPFAHYMRMDCIPRMAQRDKNCMCCSSWLQYRICHSLSTIQYVLVPQVQRQLQAAFLRAAGSKSRSRSGSGSRPRSLLQLRRGGRDHQAEGPPQDQLRNSQCQDSRETHTCQGEREPITSELLHRTLVRQIVMAMRLFVFVWRESLN